MLGSHGSALSKDVSIGSTVLIGLTGAPNTHDGVAWRVADLFRFFVRGKHTVNTIRYDTIRYEIIYKGALEITQLNLPRGTKN